MRDAIIGLLLALALVGGATLINLLQQWVRRSKQGRV